MIFIFILLCEFFVILKNKEINFNFVSEFFTFYFEVQILVI